VTITSTNDAGTRRGPAVAATGRYGRGLGRQHVTLGDGLLSDWQQRNAEVTVPHTLEQLSRAGNLHNFRRLIGEADGPYRGRYAFLDTDIYKTLEGLAYLADDQRQPGVQEFITESIRLIGSVQAQDGYIGTFYQATDRTKEPWSDLTWGHELYNLGHLIQAAVALRRQSGDDTLLQIAVRFADLVWQRYGEDGEPRYCGHPEIEMALVELFRETGDERWLCQAELFVERRGTGGLVHSIFPAEYFADHVPLRKMESVTGHAVRMMYLAAGATDVALERGDAGMLAELERLFDDMVAGKLYLTGGLGSRHTDEAIGDRFELPSDRAYAETCAAIGAMQWAWRLFLATGRSDVLDVFERVLYNAYAVGISADGAAFFYDNPLQRRPDHSQRSGAESGGELLRRSWFGCPCCPPNVIRWMAELQDHLALADDHSLTLAVLASAIISSPALDVTVQTAYPWDGTVTVTVDRASDGPALVRVRVPAWSGAVKITLNGVEQSTPIVDGWLIMNRSWRAGDALQLIMKLPVRIMEPHPHLDAVRGTVAVTCGPLVYCLEQCDVGSGVDDVVLDPAAVPGDQHLQVNGQPEDPVDAGIAVPVTSAPTAGRELYTEFRMAVESPVTDPSTARTRAIFTPYFLWGNRGAHPMRVWLRLS
jgi:DUF1680 family protein